MIAHAHPWLLALRRWWLPRLPVRSDLLGATVATGSLASRMPSLRSRSGYLIPRINLGLCLFPKFSVVSFRVPGSFPKLIGPVLGCGSHARASFLSGSSDMIATPGVEAGEQSVVVAFIGSDASLRPIPARCSFGHRTWPSSGHQCGHPRGPSTRSFGTTKASTSRCPQWLHRNRSWTSGTSPLPASTRACRSTSLARRHKWHVRRRST